MELHLATCRVDLDRATVSHPERRDQRLSAHEVGLLRYLAQRPGEVVSREELLTEVWGYHPDVASRAADLAMARLRRKVEAMPRQPVHLQSVYGEGYRFVPADGPDPVERDRFVGREALLDELDAWEGRLLTLTGPAGIGKTRLALHWARSRPALVVELGDHTEGPWLPRVAAALGVQDLPEGEGAMERLAELLAARGPLTLVLDDVDMVPDGGEAVSCWLDGAPRLRCMVTSRRRLGLRGETCLEVPPLAKNQASTLLRDRAVRPLGEVDELVDLLDGIPLAVELAAGRLRARTPAQLVDDLQRRGPLTALGTSPADALARHHTLERAIATSWDALGPREQHLWCAASRFERGFTAEALAEVVQRPVGEVLDDLEVLVDASVVSSSEPERLPGELRMHLLDALKAFGRSRDPDDVLTRRWVQVMGRMAERECSEVMKADGLVAIARVLTEIENLEGALRASVDLGEIGAAAWLFTLLLLTPVSRPIGLQPLLDGAMDLPHDDASHVLLLKAQTSLDLIAGRMEEAIATLREAAALARSAGELSSERKAEANLGQMLAHNGRVEEGLAHIRTSLQLARREGDDVACAFICLELGRRLWLEGRRDEAWPLFRESDDLSRAAGRPPMLEIRRISVQGDVLLDEGDLEGATDAIRSIRDLYDHPRLQFLIAMDLGRAAHAAGCFDEAGRELEAAIDIAEGAAYRARAGEARLQLAEVLLEAGEVEGAAALGRDLLRGDHQHNDDAVRTEALLAEAAAWQGNLEEAAAHLARARSLPEPARVGGQILALRAAMVQALGGDPDGAVEAARSLGELPSLQERLRMRVESRRSS